MLKTEEKLIKKIKLVYVTSNLKSFTLSVLCK